MLQHKGTNRIETHRLILRPFEESDSMDMYYNWASDPEVVRYLPWGPHEDYNVSKRRIEECVRRYTNSNYYNWAICRKDNIQAIGTISVEIQNDSDMACEVGYCISRAYWGQGMMPEALGAVLRYLFNEIGYQRVTARYDVGNTASGRVMQKAGMSFERIIKHCGYRRDGSPYDCAVYGKSIDEIS